MRLYGSSEASFSSNGIGFLTDAVSAYVHEEINGEFELEIQYPIDGLHYSEIELRSIITAKTEAIGSEQPFRVYRITKPINGIVTIYARHIAYDLSGYVVSPFEAESLGLALIGLKANASPTCPYTFTTDKSVSSSFKIEKPSTIWSKLGGEEGSILQTYKGEWEFDNYTCFLHNRRGQDNGVTIRYGKNMTSLEQDSNCSKVYTAVYPFWKAEDGTVSVLPEHTVPVTGTFNFTRILPLDLSESFTEAPTADQMRSKAQSYINDNDIGVPDVSWSVEFVQLEQSEEYKGMALLERVSIGDTVHVFFEKLGVNATARAVSVKYNVLLNRFDEITLGKVKSNLAKTITEQQKEIREKPSRTVIETIVERLSEGILGATGGAVRLLDTNSDGKPDELYIADNEDPALAVKVWRFNYQGWAASSNGYNGPFTMGATLDGGLLAEFVTAAHLTAGTIQSADGQSFYLNLDENVMRMGAYDTKFAEASAATDAKIAEAANGFDTKITQVESEVNEKLIPLAEISDYIQVGNIGTSDEPLFGVKIGKRDLASSFKSVFTANALEFYENNIRTAFLSNQKLNTNTIRTASMELVSPTNMGDASSVDWLVTLDNGYTIKYVGGNA